MNRLILYLLLILAAPAAAQLERPDAPLASAAQEAEARALMAELRCLQCQNQSIADSHAPQAATMRAIVRQKIAAGETPDAVRGWFVERYGDWVSFDPPARADTLLLWIGPALVLAVGLIAAARLFGKRRA